MKGFRPVNLMRVSMTDNLFRLMGEEWFLVTAGDMKSFNTMTASWGGMGHLWNKCVFFAFLRPQRHTYRFTERSGRFTISFFDRKYRRALTFCGTHSGRDVDKARATGLTPVKTPSGAVGFQEARMILDCRKLHYQDIASAGFVDRVLMKKIYPKRDFHRVYIGEIEKCWVKKNK